MVFLGIFFYRVESSSAIFIVNSSKRFYRFYVENAVQRSLTLWLAVSVVFPSNQRLYLEVTCGSERVK